MLQDLPIEIRLQICGYLIFNNRRIDVNYCNGHIDTYDYATGEYNTTNLPSSLLCSLDRESHNEMASILYGRNAFCFKTLRCANRFLAEIASYKIYLRSIEIDPDGYFGIEEKHASAFFNLLSLCPNLCSVAISHFDICRQYPQSPTVRNLAVQAHDFYMSLQRAKLDGSRASRHAISSVIRVVSEICDDCRKVTGFEVAGLALADYQSIPDNGSKTEAQDCETCVAECGKEPNGHPKCSPLQEAYEANKELESLARSFLRHGEDIAG